MSTNEARKPISRPRHHDFEAEARAIVGPNPPLTCSADALAILLTCTGKAVRDQFKAGKLRGCRVGRAIRLNVSDARRLLGIED